MTKFNITTTPIYLVLGAESFAVASVEISFESDGINSAICTLAAGVTGRRQSVTAGSTGYANKTAKFKRGVAAAIVLDQNPNVTASPLGFQFSPSGGVLFSGYVDEGGPSGMSFGSFVIRVKLVGSLHALNSGTIQVSNIIPTSYADTTRPIAVFNPDSSLPPFMSPEAISNDFGAALVESFTAMANGQGVAAAATDSNIVMSELLKIFKSGSNTAAADVLKVIAPHLKLRISSPGFVNTLWAFYNMTLATDFRYESFLGRLSSLGQLLKFKIIETPTGISIMPFSPFIISSVATEITPDQYSSIGWASNGNTQYIGCALVSGDSNTSSDNLLAGVYKRPGTSTGVIATYPAPSILKISGKISTGADSDNRTPFASKEVRDLLGDAYARELCLEAAYGQKSLVVTCPYLRTDIGQLTAVKVTYPKVVENVAGAEVYGSVLRVRISIDATQQHASTSYDIGFVRSYEQQYTEIDNDSETSGVPHPIWQKNVYRTRLDGNTETDLGFF